MKSWDEKTPEEKKAWEKATELWLKSLEDRKPPEEERRLVLLKEFLERLK